MDDPALAGQVARSSPEAYWMWASIGPWITVHGGHSESLLRVCPTCKLAIVNEDMLMAAHIEYHRVHGH